MADNTIAPGEKARVGIATQIIIYGTVVLGLVAISIIIAGLIIASRQPATDKGMNLVTDVFHSLLPVIAAWIGAVIAFYFGKENFESANKSVQDMVKQITNADDKLKATKVSDKDVMRLIADISYNKDIIDKEDKDINVSKDLLDFIDNNKKGDRLPVFDNKAVCRYIIHQSTLNEFIRRLSTGKYPNIKDKTLEEITLDHMVNNSDEEMKNKLTKSQVFVSKDATLFEAKEKMTGNKWSQDVFVTDTGKATEPVIGWITNNKIAELSKI